MKTYEVPDDPSTDSRTPLRLELKVGAKGQEPTTFWHECDVFMAATGRSACSGGLFDEDPGTGGEKVDMDRRGQVVVDESTCATSIRGIYAAGHGQRPS